MVLLGSLAWFVYKVYYFRKDLLQAQKEQLDQHTKELKAALTEILETHQLQNSVAKT